MKKEFSDRISIIDKALENYVPAKSNPQSKIYEAMRYSLFAGGKRLRPILMLETAKMCGKDWEDIKPFACALEMIHTYSLIHDDLPAMDDDDLRRGKPTNHIVFGEDIAILAGDALLNKAFEIVSEAEYSDCKNALKAISVLATASGSEGMIGGQVVDLDSEGKDISLSQLQYIHLLKTGALIRAACVVAAVIADVSDEEKKAIDEFATALGVAFQIRDDILDVIGQTELLGKPVGSDETMQKNTYVSLLGIEKSEELVKEYSEKAIKSLECFGEKARFLINLTNYLVERNN